MTTVIFKNEKAIFYFDLQDVSSSLQEESLLGQNKDAVELAMFLEISTGEIVNIPKDEQFFKYITLALLRKGRGSALCNRCKEKYLAEDLQSHIIRSGETPLRVKIRRKGVILRLFSRKIRRTGMMGGKGYSCPEDH